MGTVPLGQYKLGHMYSETFISGEIYDAFDPIHNLSSIVIDDPTTTLRQIILLHESAHYVHDLSLGTCLSYDLLLDRSAAVTFELIRHIMADQKVNCPLKSLRSESIEKYRNTLDYINYCNNIANFLLCESTTIDHTSFPQLEDFGVPDGTELTTMHLLEGIIAIKTLIALAQRASTIKEREYLKEISDEFKLLPHNSPPIYNLALKIFDATIGTGIVGTANLGRDWPYDFYNKNGRNLIDTSFLYVADIALHIPGLEFMEDLVKKSINSWEDFQPVKRFLKSIEILRENHGFPDSDSTGGKGFYRVLYNWLAEKASWPGYEDTQMSWEATFFTLRDKKRKSMSDGYRARMITQRHDNSYNIILNQSLNTCAQQAVPIIHLMKNGLKILRFFETDAGLMRLPYDMPGVPVWELMNYNSITWQNIDEGQGYPEALKLELDRGFTFLQEIVFRSNCRAFQAAVISYGYFQCPWSVYGCHVAQPECKRLELKDLPKQECSIRRYLETFLRIVPEKFI